MTDRIPACTNGTDCVDLTPGLLPGWFAMSDTKDPDGPTLEFDTAELDAFVATWLAGRWGNDPAPIVEGIAGPLKARIAELEAEREHLRQQIAADILGLKEYYGDNVHARFALGFAADIARGTRLELRGTQEPTP